MAFVRQSKYRHIFGKVEKKENNYEDIRITETALEATYCAANPKFVAIVTKSAGGGAFLVLPLEQTGRVGINQATVCGHKQPVLDVAWNPFNDNMIASASEDGSIKLWEIPDGGLTEPMTEALCTLEFHQKRVVCICWHPVAENILLSASQDPHLCVWNLDDGEVVAEFSFGNIPYSASFNRTGSKIVATCKDKNTYIFNARTLEVEKKFQMHEGSKPSRAIFLKDDRLFSTGFSKMSERQLILWDKNYEQMEIMELDTSNGIMFPFYDPDTEVVYVCGKGDSVIRYYEIDQETMHYITTFQDNEPQRGIAMLPKRGVKVNDHEITRFYKLVKGGCKVITFVVPRKSDLFQADIYPDTASNEAALTADEWIDGKDVEPPMMSMEQFYTGQVKQGGGGLKKGGGLGGLKKKKPATTTASSTPKPSPPVVKEPEKPKPSPVVEKPKPKPVETPKPVEKPKPVETPKPEVPKPAPAKVESNSAAAAGPVISQEQLDSILSDLRKVKIIVKGHDKRIKDLEDKLKQYEETDSDQDQEV